MIKNENLIKRTLSWQMFGKVKKDLTPDELREYNRERKRQSRLNPETLQRDREYTKNWKKENRERYNESTRKRRAIKKCQNKTN